MNVEKNGLLLRKTEHIRRQAVKLKNKTNEHCNINLTVIGKIKIS
jgi:hypothetical protein